IKRFLLADADHRARIRPIRTAAQRNLIHDRRAVDEPADRANVSPAQRRVIEYRRILDLARVQVRDELIARNAECFRRRIQIQAVAALVLYLGHQNGLALQRPRSRSRAGEIEAPNPFVARWVPRALAADPPRARSLIVTVWGDALAPHGGGVWLSGLIRLMAPFGMSERLVRTSVFRLVRDGWLKGQTLGRRSRYRLTREGARRFEAAHHRIYAMPAPQWGGDWAIVIAPPDAAPNPTRIELRDELAWEGFGAIAPGVYVKPL